MKNKDHPGNTDRVLGIGKEKPSAEEFQSLFLDLNKEEVEFIVDTLHESFSKKAISSNSGEWIPATHVYKSGEEILAVLTISLPPPQLNIPPQISMLLSGGDRIDINPQYDHSGFSIEKTQSLANKILKDRGIICDK